MGAATCTELKPEQALAKRWLRTAHLPLPVWQWLCGRSVALQSHLPPASPLLLKSLQAFAEPLGSHSNAQERQSLDDCLASVAQLISFANQQARGPALGCQQRMLASSLLPLYRGLARGSVAEVTSVLRRQLAEALALSATLTEFRDELSELLCGAMVDDHSPYLKLKTVLQVDLEQLTQVLLGSATRWDGKQVDQLDALARDEIKIDWRPAWGQPEVLWRLAGELIAQRAEFVVPRDWIDVPVPWNEASEHWLDIVHALEHTPNSKPANDANTAANIPANSTTNSTTNNASTSVANPVVSPTTDTATTATVPVTASASPSAMAAGKDAEEALSPTASDPTPLSAAAAVDQALSDDVQRLKLEIEIADAVDSLVQASRQASGNMVGNRADGSHPPQSPRPRSDDFVVPKIIIAEVRSHNDPAFVAVVRRQLALCRSEERSMSLLAVRVSPDGEEGNMPTLQSLGLASWQQKLVNWLSDHPEIHDPYAFLSNEGELILSLMDIERNTATLILRQGLTEVLSGGSNDQAALSRASIPALYHSGIGSVTSPTANFEPEQLIESTYRCLDAATRQGKASIKSIEVF